MRRAKFQFPQFLGVDCILVPRIGRYSGDRSDQQLIGIEGEAVYGGCFGQLEDLGGSIGLWIAIVAINVGGRFGDVRQTFKNMNKCVIKSIITYI